MKPLIGITTYLIEPEQRTGYGSARQQVAEAAFSESVSRAGGSPLLLPQVTEQAAAYEILEHLDGLILIGGSDVDPALYGQDGQPGLGVIDSPRDQSDVFYLSAACELSLPVLGVCRGMQVMNAYYGGTLYQDLPQEREQTIEHRQASAPYLLAHEVQIDPSSYFYRIIKKETLRVNSFHHQAIKDLAPKFKAVAHSQDGLIEAIEYERLLGVQWHPEVLAAHEPEQERIFVWLIQQAQEGLTE